MKTYEGFLKTEGVLVEIISINIHRHLLALMYLKIGQIFSTFPSNTFSLGYLDFEIFIVAIEIRYKMDLNFLKKHVYII